MSGLLHRKNVGGEITWPVIPSAVWLGPWWLKFHLIAELGALNAFRHHWQYSILQCNTIRYCCPLTISLGSRFLSVVISRLTVYNSFKIICSIQWWLSWNNPMRFCSNDHFSVVIHWLTSLCVNLSGQGRKAGDVLMRDLWPIPNSKIFVLVNLFPAVTDFCWFCSVFKN